MPESPFSNSPFVASSEQPSGGFPDIGFVHFVTPALITIIWWLTVIAAICSCLFWIYFISLFEDIPGAGKGVVVLLVILITVDGLLWCRVILEFFAIQFRMERHQRTIKKILERNEQMSKL